MHPNVDKKSFINWKQRDIHEKRELRRREMQDLRDEIALNAKLDGKLGEVSAQRACGGDGRQSVRRGNGGRGDDWQARA